MALDKTATYDRITGDYAMHLDGLFIGYARNQREADMTLNATAYEWLIHGYTATAEQLDGGCEPPPDDAPGGDDEETGPYARSLMLMPEGDILDADGMRVSSLSV